jgi:hypothetical protein
MRAHQLLSMYRHYRSQTGIVGVAYGPKEVEGNANGNDASIAFFVSEKLPVAGAKRSLADGRRRLPKFVESDGQIIPTDVVTTNSAAAADIATRSPPQTYRSGGKVSNMQLTGTVGCLVASNTHPGVYALTNQHIGLGPGTVVAFPDFRSIGAIVGTTTASAGLVADEQFLPPFDQPQSYIDVDCALVRIPPNFENRFSPEIPIFGRPAAAFSPDIRTPAAFINSLVGLQVYSYGWPSGARGGVVSHAYYVYQRDPAGMAKIASFLVKSLDSGPPGVLGDSGKLWMTKINGQNFGVGIHSGVVADSPSSSRFAMSTEFSSLLRFLNIRLL